MVKDDRKYILHILACITRIEEDVSGGRTAFDRSHTIQDAVIRNLQVIAESTKRLSENFRAGHTSVDWPSIVGLRNVLVHDYFGVDLGVVWQIVERDVPELKATLERVLG